MKRFQYPQEMQAGKVSSCGLRSLRERKLGTPDLRDQDFLVITLRSQDCFSVLEQDPIFSLLSLGTCYFCLPRYSRQEQQGSAQKPPGAMLYKADMAE